ncbi:MAG: hypothetical protein ABIF10_02510 [Candidatus Woesearchaeota archaeon]
MRAILFAILLFVCMDCSSAAIVKGTVYDMDLRPAVNAVVTIDSVPKQVYVAHDSTYRFSLQQGNYTITASYLEDYSAFSIEQNLTILADGDYTVDLLLFPDISDEQGLLNQELDVPSIALADGKFSLLLVGLIIFLVVLAIILLAIAPLYRRARIKFEPDSLPEEIIGFVRKSGGRVTQKDIRRKFPVSEAKISLVLTELEAKGRVQKIKKGKGNIVVLRS